MEELANETPCRNAQRACRVPAGNTALLWLTVLLSVLPGRMAAQNVTPATVQNVQINDTFAHSLVVRWDAPLNSGLSGVVGYAVSWAVAGSSATTTKMTIPCAYQKMAFQIQPLVQNQNVNVTITPIDQLGALGTPLLLPNLAPKGTVEANLRQLTNNGLSGFLYLPQNDAVNGRVNPLKINSDFFNLHAGDGNGTLFDHSCVAVNNQQHWHMVANDMGTGSITSRIKAVIPIDTRNRALIWDCDGGPTARQTWYVVLTPNKVEQFLLFPNNGDTATTGVYPLEQIQIRFDGPNARFLRYSGGNLVGEANFNWRNVVYTNVRQLMQLSINTQGVLCYADTGYTGQTRLTGAFKSDLSTWNSCYAYFTLGSYNNKKTNTVHGLSATGQDMLEYEGGNMHWGNVAIVTPDGAAPPVELSYFQQADLTARDAALDLTSSPGLTLTIPDAIPTDAVSQELVFTDRNGCMPCLSGRNKLLLRVNGLLLPNKQEAAAWADYPTYRWQIPAGVLKRGVNTVVFGQTGTPDPIGVSNIHFDISVPVTSSAIAAYTAPAPHPILETMPDHTVLEGWTIPSTWANIPQTLMAGMTYVPVYADSGSTAHLSGSYVPFDMVWAELDGQTVWTKETNTAGLGTIGYTGGFMLNTKQVADGYHSLIVKAHSKSGSVGYSDGSSQFSYDFNYKILISNQKPNKTVPVIQNVVNLDPVTNLSAVLKPGDSFYVRQGQYYDWSFDVVSPNLLTQVQLYLTYADGSSTLYRSYNPAVPYAAKQTAAGTVTTFGDTQCLYNWWGFDAKGQDHFLIKATDVFGNTSQFAYSWSLVAPPTPPDPNANAVLPKVLSLTSDPLVVQKGWACLLSWNTSGAAAVSLDNGIGPLPAYGKVCVTPTQTTTYTLTATSVKGTVTKTITVIVSP